MSLSILPLFLPPNALDIRISDIDADQQMEIIVLAKNSAEAVPSGRSLFVYEKEGESWSKTQQVDLGTQPLFWQVYKGIWGMDSSGIVDLYRNQRKIESFTWLKGLAKTSPKEAEIVADLDWDGQLEFILNSNGSIQVFSEDGHDWGSLNIPRIGSIRSYTKTGGQSLEVAQRSASVLVQDFDGDSVQDILFLHSEKAEVYLTKGKQIGVRKLDISLPINVEPQYNSRPKKELNLVRFEDCDADGTVDILWQYWVTGESWFGATSEIGFAKGTGIGFTDVQIIKQDKAIFNIQLEDIDGDSDLDIVLAGTDLGIASLSKALLTKSASVGIEYYELQEGEYSSSSQSIHRLSVAVGRDDGIDYSLKLDRNGDQKKDLIFMEELQFQELHSSASGYALAETTALQGTGDIFVSQENGSDQPIVIWDRRSLSAYVPQ